MARTQKFKLEATFGTRKAATQAKRAIKGTGTFLVRPVKGGKKFGLFRFIPKNLRF